MMKKMSFFVIGLLLMSIVAMSGCTDNKASDNTTSTEENAGNVSPNNTMPPGGENPGQMPYNNSTMPPGGNPGQMPYNNSTMPQGGNPGQMPYNNSTMPPGGALPAGNSGNMS